MNLHGVCHQGDLRSPVPTDTFHRTRNTLGGYMKSVTLHIDGMSCGHCLNAVNQALAGVDGATIRSVRIGRAEVDLADPGPGSDALVTAVEEAGYTVRHVDGVS